MAEKLKLIIYLMMILISVSFASATEVIVDSYTGAVNTGMTQGFFNAGANEQWSGLVFTVNATPRKIDWVYIKPTSNSGVFTNAYFEIWNCTGTGSTTEPANSGTYWVGYQQTLPFAAIALSSLIRVNFTNAGRGVLPVGTYCLVQYVVGGTGNRAYVTDATTSAANPYQSSVSSDHGVTWSQQGLLVHYSIGYDASVSVSIITPSNNTRNNSEPVNINYSVSSGTSPYNCSMFVNSTLNASQIGVTTGGIFNFSYDGTQDFLIKISCLDSASQVGNSSIVLKYDDVAPSITLQNNNFFLADNSTILYNNLLIYQMNLSFYDTNLFQSSVNLTNSSNNTIYSNLQTDINTSTYNLYPRINFSTFKFGNYKGVIEACDDHTDLTLFDMPVLESSSKIIFNNDVGVELIGETPESIKYEKLADRYTLDFQTKTDGLKTYKPYCDGLLYYRPLSKYKAHFVCIGKAKYWLDFENPENKEVSVLIVGKEYYITTEAKSFNSIGGLNCVEKHYTFNYQEYVEATSSSGGGGGGFASTAGTTDAVKDKVYTAFLNDYLHALKISWKRINIDLSGENLIILIADSLKYGLAYARVVYTKIISTQGSILQMELNHSIN